MSPRAQQSFTEGFAASRTFRFFLCFILLVFLIYGLAGRYNPAIAKLMLSANHGLTEVSKSINELTVVPSLTDEEKEGMLMLLR